MGRLASVAGMTLNMLHKNKLVFWCEKGRGVTAVPEGAVWVVPPVTSFKAGSLTVAITPSTPARGRTQSGPHQKLEHTSVRIFLRYQPSTMQLNRAHIFSYEWRRPMHWNRIGSKYKSNDTPLTTRSIRLNKNAGLSDLQLCSGLYRNALRVIRNSNQVHSIMKANLTQNWA